MSDRPSGIDPVDDLVESFLARYRLGERPSLTEYTDAHPELAGRIRAIFPALLVREELGPGDRQSSGSLAGQTAPEASMPQRLGDYVLLRAIGAGGMGIVYEAIQESLGRHVALKVLPFHRLGDATRLERFRREARAAARLHHAYIVPVYGIGEHDGLHYYTMQFIRGHGLDSVLREVRRLRTAPSPPAAAEVLTGHFSSTSLAHQLFSGRLSAGKAGLQEAESLVKGVPAATAMRPTGLDDRPGLSEQPEAQYVQSMARIAAQVAEALEYAHQQGILHRDIKPSNLILDGSGQIWVADFGLAKAADSDELTRTGDVVGTLRYMAPERFNGWSDPRSDVYALGATLYEMLTLRPPFEDPDRFKLIDRVLHEGPPPLRQLDRRIPPDIETIVSKALAKEPGERYATAGQMAEDLLRFIAGKPILARRFTSVERLWRWSLRNKLLAGAVTAVAAALVAVAVISIVYASEQAKTTVRIRGLAEELGAKSDSLSKSLKESNHLLAIRNFDRGQAAFDNDQIGPGLLWMIESGRAAVAAGDPAWQHAARANLSAWSREYPALLAVFSHARPIIAVAISANGKTVATGSEDETARLWDITTGGPIGPPLEHPGIVRALRFSPDGKRLATGSAKVVRLWDATSAKLVGSLAFPELVTAVAYSAGGTRLLALGANGSSQVWDTASEKPLGSLSENPGTNLVVAYSPDGKTILTGSLESQVRFWDSETLRMIGSPIRNIIGSILAAAFSPDGKTFLLACGPRAQLWDVATRKPVGKPMNHVWQVRFVSFSPDGKTILTGSVDKTARLWNVSNQAPIGPVYRQEGPIEAGAISPDGKTFVTAGGDYTARAWAIGVESRTPLTVGHGARIGPVAFRPDGRVFFTVMSDRTVRRWDSATGRPVGQPLSHPGDLGPLSISPDGKTASTGCSDHFARVWDLASGQVSGQPLEHQAEVSVVAFSPNGKVLLTGGQDRIARLWDATTRAPLVKPLLHKQRFLEGDGMDGSRCKLLDSEPVIKVAVK